MLNRRFKHKIFLGKNRPTSQLSYFKGKKKGHHLSKVTFVLVAGAGLEPATFGL